jgi:osmoprotectant transport system substrate-binding protein
VKERCSGSKEMKNEGRYEMKNLHYWMIAIGFLFLAGGLAGCGRSSDQIIIGSKNFTENMILGEIFTQLIREKTDLKAVHKESLGGTMVCFEAIRQGALDIYPEYTGTGLTAHLKMNVIHDADRVYDIVKKEFAKRFAMEWLDPLGFNNTYAIAVKQSFAQKHNLTNVSQLASLAPNLKFGAEHEFFDRQDGYDGMSHIYGLHFKGEPVKMDVALKYQAISEDKIDVTDAFSTDGQLIRYKLKTLEDDRKFFPPYYAAPIIRKATLKKHPELKKVLNMLAGKISDMEMQQMNYQAECEKKSIQDVAHDFLVAKGLAK